MHGVSSIIAVLETNEPFILSEVVGYGAVPIPGIMRAVNEVKILSKVETNFLTFILNTVTYPGLPSCFGVTRWEA
jgi:hypothetical protein